MPLIMFFLRGTLRFVFTLKKSAMILYSSQNRNASNPSTPHHQENDVHLDHVPLTCYIGRLTGAQNNINRKASIEIIK